MRPLRRTSILFIVFMGMFSLCGLTKDGLASRCIVITYDRSSSMYSLQSAQTNTHQDTFFLSAGEFKQLRDAVIHIVLDGDPTLNPAINPSKSTAYFFTSLMIPEDKERLLPLWKMGDSVVYVDYSRESGNRKWVEYDSRQAKDKSAQGIREALQSVIPYPKGVPDSANSIYDTNARRAFKQAFPGNASIQDLAELAAYEVLQHMIANGDSKAEVYWIQVSDMDQDNTGDTALQAEAVDILTNLRRIQQQLGDKFLARPVYEILAANRIHVRVNALSSDDFRSEIEKLKTRIENLNFETDKFDSDLHDFENDMASFREKIDKLNDNLIKTNTGIEKKEDADEAFQQLKQLIDEYDQEVTKLKTLVASLKPEDLKSNANAASKKRLEEINRIKESLISKRKALEELQKKSEQLIHDAEKRMAELDKPTLLLSLDGNALPDKEIKITLPFRRTDPDSSMIRCEGLSLIPSSGYTCKNFEISAVKVWLLDDASHELEEQEYAVVPAPEPGTGFNLEIPDYNKVPELATKAAILVVYQHLGKGGNRASYEKQWVFEKISIPGRGGVGALMLIFGVLALVVILVLVIFLTKSGARAQNTAQAPSDQEDQEDWEKGAKQNVFTGAGSEEEIPGQEQDNSQKSSARLKSGTQTQIIQAGENWVLSDSDGTFGASVWHLNCPGNTIRLEGGFLYLNSRVINQGETIALQDSEGNEVLLKVELLE